MRIVLVALQVAIDKYHQSYAKSNSTLSEIISLYGRMYVCMYGLRIVQISKTHTSWQ